MSVETAHLIAIAAAGQVNDNDDAMCVETLVEGLVTDALRTAEARTAALADEVERLRKALGGIMDDLQDNIEADMGRELRERDLPLSWRRARALLTQADGGADG